MSLTRYAKENKTKREAYRLRDKGDLKKAIDQFVTYLKSQPNDVVAALDLGHCHMQLEQFEEACRVYAKIIEKDNKHVFALSNLGGALLRSGKPRDAKAILEYVLELDPQCLYAHINLGGVFQALGDLRGNLDSALAAVSIDPKSALAFNNLGSALSELAMFHDAKHAYETAAMLQPNQVDTLINLAAVEARLGDSDQAIRMYEKTLTLIPKHEKHRIEAIRFFCSFEYLKTGNLEKGWDYYEGGFSPMVPITGARTPKRTFPVPAWNGEDLTGKRLLVWREQGLGDEILFGSCLPDLLGLGAEKIILECDGRLVPILSRSFPDFIVREQAYYSPGGAPVHKDFDLHIPIGSLMRHLRRTIESFDKSGPYLIPSEDLVEHYREKLRPFPAKPVIGICWRSGKLSPVRNLSYTSLMDWEPILRLDVNIVSLQYGDAEAEIKEAEEKLGIRIIHWPDLDQKNDLEKVFALMANLDLVISVNTAPLRMSSAIGVPVLSVQRGGWTMLGEESSQTFPWFRNNHLLQADLSGKFDSRMLDLSSLVVNYFDVD